MQIGFVPNRPSLPCHGATIGEALQNASPIFPVRAILAAHHAAAPK
jgi:hypothetical protein